jgi:uncharacterized DUF497 family protein
MRYVYRWNTYNLGKAARHGVSFREAEWVVDHARPPFPSYEGDGKHLVSGQTEHGRFIQVAYIIDDDGTLFVIHARPLTESDKRRLRRRRR